MVRADIPTGDCRDCQDRFVRLPACRIGARSRRAPRCNPPPWSTRRRCASPPPPRRAPRPMSRATAIAIRSRRSPSSACSPSDTVVEIWPGGGWYSEILAPYLAQGGGTYIGVASEQGLTGLNKLVAAQPAAYAKVRTANFPILDAGGTAGRAGQRRRRADLPQRPQLDDGRKPFEAAGVRANVRDAQARRDARRGRASPARKRRRGAREDERLRQGLDRAPARRSGRVPAGGGERDQRQPARHQGSSRRRVDPAARPTAWATRTARNMPRSAKATA